MTEMVIREGSPLPLGVRKIHETICFSVSVRGADECKLNLYEKGKSKIYKSILMGRDEKVGCIFYTAIEKFDHKKYEYLFEAAGKTFIDPYAAVITGRSRWGKKLVGKEKELVRGGLSFESYMWGNDRTLKIPYEDLILYRLHPRGFTKDVSSKVDYRGKFTGIIEKIPYLKELGINAVELLPSYEFNEILPDKTLQDRMNSKFVKPDEIEVTKINYWGFSRENFYFAPKMSYGVVDSIREMKDLVKALHQNGIEVIMEFHFQEGTNEQLIIDCLRNWVLEYHIDGFHVNQNVVPSKLVATDPVLAETKLFGLTWNIEEIYGEEKEVKYRSLGEYNDGFLIDARRFLKGDEDQVSQAAYRIKRNPINMGVINFITNTNGFTLQDLFSYDVKHNEGNNEGNHDGTDYNYSWNCGFEGETKRSKILELRRRQLRNALMLLMFSQGTPLILSGDEFGNSQKGNNNAYCQDNKISWLNWKQLDTNRDIFEFLKILISIRKDHPILHKNVELRGMDYISCGCPDISFHSTKAWYPDYSNYNRVLGIMLCGKYAMKDEKVCDDYFYLAFNMHWADHEFDLPKLPGHIRWGVLIDSVSSESSVIEDQKRYNVKARSIVVFIGSKTDTL